MIKLYVEDYCQNCPEFEPDVDKKTMHADRKLINITDIRCEHRHICDMLINYLEKQHGREHEKGV